MKLSTVNLQAVYKHRMGILLLPGIILILWIWTHFADNLFAFVVIAAIAAFCCFSAMFHVRNWRRISFAQQHLREHCRLDRLVRSQLIGGLWLAGKAIIMAIFLLSSAVLWSDAHWWLLGVDGLLIVGIIRVSNYLLENQFLPASLTCGVYGIALRINTVMMAVTSFFITYYYTPRLSMLQYDSMQAIEVTLSHLHPIINMLAPLTRGRVAMDTALWSSVEKAATIAQGGIMEIISSFGVLVTISLVEFWIISTVFIGAYHVCQKPSSSSEQSSQKSSDIVSKVSSR